jgi:acylphosphatase
MDRTALKAYIKNSCDGAITVMKNYTDDQIRGLIRDYIKTRTEVEEVEEVEEEESETQTNIVAEVKKEDSAVTKKTITSTNKTTNDRLAKLKEKHGLQ